MPIIEVPSDTSRPESARTNEVSTYRSDDLDLESEIYSGDNFEEDEKGDVDGSESQRSKSHKKKRRHKHRKHGLSMTPPDKLLRRAEKDAKRYAENDRIAEAIVELIRCTALARIVHGDGHWKLAETFINLADGYLDLKGYAPQAQYHAENARAIMLGGVQTSSSQHDKAKILKILINIYYTLGRSLTKLKKLQEADQALQRAERIAEERGKMASVTSDECDEIETKISIALARCHAMQQKFASSISYFDKAIDLISRTHGKDSIKLIQVHQDLGKVEQSKGRHANHERAIEMYLQAHSIAGANYSEGTIELAETARALATAYSNTGDPDGESSAESYLNECLATYQSTYGPEHEKTLEVQDELARLMIRTERYEEALSLLRSTLSPKTEVYGEYSDEVADTYKLMGSVRLSQGDMEKALKVLKKCHNIECVSHGPNQKRTKETQKTIDVIMANPAIASKMPKSKTEELQSRPRFNSVVNRSSPVAGGHTF